MYIGTILGVAIGLFTLGPLGAILGGAAGLMFDKGRQRSAWKLDPEQKQEIEQAFFNTVFPLMGILAKADGRVCEKEVDSTEKLIQSMRLEPEKRKEAIQLFQSGSKGEKELAPVVESFLSHCGSYKDLKQLLIVYLMTLAFADGELDPAEEKILETVAGKLGYSSLAFNHLLGMVKAQFHFDQRHQRSAGPHTNRSSLAKAYEALGVESSATDAELKRAYRKLMSEYHPDKLAGQGVPEHVIKVATEKSQEIQSAYEVIKKARKASS